MIKKEDLPPLIIPREIYKKTISDIAKEKLYLYFTNRKLFFEFLENENKNKINEQDKTPKYISSNFQKKNKLKSRKKKDFKNLNDISPDFFE